MEIAVIGGGISGLTAAYHLQQKLAADDVIRVYEAERQVGGVIRSDRLLGMVVEGGPDTLFVKEDWLREWISELKLDSDIVYPRPGIKSAWRITTEGESTGPSSTDQGITFREGMAQLPKRLAEKLKGKIKLGSTITLLQPDVETTGFKIHRDRRIYLADAVVLATPAPIARRLMAGWQPTWARELDTIGHRPRALVVGLYAKDAIPERLYQHSGFWNGPGTPWLMDACTVLSRKWQYPDDGTYVALRTFWGAHPPVDVRTWSDEDMMRHHGQELNDLAGVKADPVVSTIYRWNQALPQIDLDQQQRIADWRQTLLRLYPNLAIVGAFMGGVGVASCIKDAMTAAEQLAQWIIHQPGRPVSVPPGS